MKNSAELPALFIPLKSDYFEQFVAGLKTEEFRAYGPRWNEKTCIPGRPVVISKGYGKKHRARGFVESIMLFDVSLLSDELRRSLVDCYGAASTPSSVIAIKIAGLVVDNKPPRRADLRDFEKLAGISDDVLVRVRGFSGHSIGRYVHGSEEWQVNGFGGSPPDVEEWWPLPKKGTGTKQ